MSRLLLYRNTAAHRLVAVPDRAVGSLSSLVNHSMQSHPHFQSLRAVRGRQLFLPVSQSTIESPGQMVRECLAIPSCYNPIAPLYSPCPETDHEAPAQVSAHAPLRGLAPAARR